MAVKTIENPEAAARKRIAAMCQAARVFVRVGKSAPADTTLGALLAADDGLWADRDALFATLWRRDVYRCGGGAAPEVVIWGAR